MRTTVGQTLEGLSRAFAVRDIMIHQNQLTRARDLGGAAAIFADPQCDFDVIPLPESGPISAYVTKGSGKLKQVAPPALVSDGTTILDLLDIFHKNQPFAFVLAKNTICGFVHFSDLNEPLVKLPFFILMERVEAVVWSMIETVLNPTVLSEVFDDKRCERIEERKRDAKRKNLDRGYQGALYMDDILTFACHRQFISVTPQDKEAISKVRNKVFHADKPLVDTENDLKTMIRARDACTFIIEGAEADKRSSLY